MSWFVAHAPMFHRTQSQWRLHSEFNWVIPSVGHNRTSRRSLFCNRQGKRTNMCCICCSKGTLLILFPKLAILGLLAAVFFSYLAANDKLGKCVQICGFCFVGSKLLWFQLNWKTKTDSGLSLQNVETDFCLSLSGFFESTVAELSDLFQLEITPADWTFYIWGVIYAYQVKGNFSVPSKILAFNAQLALRQHARSEELPEEGSCPIARCFWQSHSNLLQVPFGSRILTLTDIRNRDFFVLFMKKSNSRWIMSFQGLWLLYGLTLFCRRNPVTGKHLYGSPSFISVWVYILMVVNFGSLIAWLFFWDAQRLWWSKFSWAELWQILFQMNWKIVLVFASEAFLL